ncbi:MAG TPA: hypothetical protein VNY73_08570 [Bacteroidia bacterium]|jgi:hypothetical protein|nr:hypothetical protein [Bacteroidia bacterium]
MKKTAKHIFIAGLFVAASYVAQAGPPPPPGGGSTPSCWPPPCLPIDGGISFLIAAAAVYGGKKLYDYQKNS